jgi:flagellar biosynthesis protein FlhF
MAHDADMRRDIAETGCSGTVIYTKRYVKGGILGFFGQPVVQITVAINDAPETAGDNTAATPSVTTQAPKSAAAAPRPAAARTSRNGSHRRRPRRAASSHRRRARTAAPQQTAPSQRLVATAAPVRQPAATPALAAIFNALCDQDIDRRLAEKLVTDFGVMLGNSRDFTVREATDYLVARLGRLIPVAGPIQLQERHLKVAAFVGPTGAGKTTTIAKLAADFTFISRKRAALITIDTFRVGAVEQLHKYAEILNIPMEVVNTPEALKQAVNRNADRDIILIDTAGRSPRDGLCISELNSFLSAVNPVETHLVISAGTRERDALAIVDKFSAVNVARLIFTKFDVVVGLGSIVNLTDRITIPLSYVTTGQNVPRDIETADSRKIAHQVVSAMHLETVLGNGSNSTGEAIVRRGAPHV